MNQSTTQQNGKIEQRMRSIMDRWAEPVYRHVRRMVVNHADAQDVVQETFIKVYRNLDQLRNPEAIKSWLYRIATNEALRHIEELKRSASVNSAADLAEADSLQADEFFDFSDLEVVTLQKAIHRLPSKQQIVFLLRYYDDLSFAEIAEIVGGNASTAKVNYHFAKNKVTEYLLKNEL